MKQQAARNHTISIGLPFACIIGIFVHPYAGLFLGLVVLIMALSHHGDRVIESGARGEDLALGALADLPDFYAVFN